LGIGIFEGRDAIRGLFADWVEPYEEYEAKCEEFRDLGNGRELRCAPPRRSAR
jgi:hypothetical protein